MPSGRLCSGRSATATGAVVSPLVGLGNILHSTAIVFVVLALTVLWLSRRSKALAPDLQK